MNLAMIGAMIGKDFEISDELESQWPWGNQRWGKFESQLFFPSDQPLPPMMIWSKERSCKTTRGSSEQLTRLPLGLGHTMQIKELRAGLCLLELERAKARARRPGLNAEPAVHKLKARGLDCIDCNKSSNINLAIMQGPTGFKRNLGRPSPTRARYTMPDEARSPYFRSLFQL